MRDRVLITLGHLTFPRWIYRGPLWWRSINGWWLQWWGYLFYEPLMDYEERKGKE